MHSNTIGSVLPLLPILIYIATCFCLMTLRTIPSYSGRYLSFGRPSTRRLPIIISYLIMHWNGWSVWFGNLFINEQVK